MVRAISGKARTADYTGYSILICHAFEGLICTYLYGVPLLKAQPRAEI